MRCCLKLSPLKFLRRDLKKKPKKKAFKLNTKIPFITRFKLRIILQNLPGYSVMAIGIILGALIIIFGDLFGTIFDDYAVTMEKSVICDYQYVLSQNAETENSSAEKYSMTSLEFGYKNFMKDELTIYGVEENSRYIGADTANGKTAVSSTISEKYGIGAGDTITLSDPYSRDKKYTFTIDSVYDYDVTLAVFISRSTFNERFGKSAEDFTGYFSNEQLTDISDDNVFNIITVNDYTKLSEQMEHSIGAFMVYFEYFGVIMFLLIMYILSKQIIERNFQSISMCKILGFGNGEIGKLYIVSTSIVVVVGLIAAIPITDFILHLAFKEYLYKFITGYFPCNVRSESYVKMAVIGIMAYALVAGLQLLKIKRIPKGEALKNTE